MYVHSSFVRFPGVHISQEVLNGRKCNQRASCKYREVIVLNDEPAAFSSDEVDKVQYFVPRCETENVAYFCLQKLTNTVKRIIHSQISCVEWLIQMWPFTETEIKDERYTLLWKFMHVKYYMHKFGLIINCYSRKDWSLLLPSVFGNVRHKCIVLTDDDFQLFKQILRPRCNISHYFLLYFSTESKKRIFVPYLKLKT